VDELRRFGYLPQRLELSGDDFTISSLDTFDQAIETVSKSQRLRKGWLWPPTTDERNFDPQPRFTVPFTHELSLHRVRIAEADELAEFLVAVLGFLHGIVLIPEDWFHVTRVYTVPEGMREYVLRDSARLRVLEAAILFWRSKEKFRQHLFGIMYWHCAASAFMQDYEVFAWHYTVLDACWRLHASLNSIATDPPHADRIKHLANAYHLTLPGPWEGGKAIARIRNDLVHQARWGGAPIGFGGYPEIGYGINPHGGGPLHSIPVIRTLVSFTTRVILAILGESAPYLNLRIGDGWLYE
jgi:hypothetical protein